jgi:putative DNA primase/helicase
MPPDGAEGLRRLGMVEVQPDHGLELRRVSDIAARQVQWLWLGRIPRGKVTMLAGHPGLGKSQLVLAIAAIVTTGGRLPVDGTRAENGSAVILSAEDDAEDTIRPRLDAAGADLARCQVIGAVRDRRNGGCETRRGFSVLDDLPLLATELAGIGDAALVVIDPITAYLGAIDSHRNAEVRAALAPLAELAAQYRVAVLAVSHLRKSLDGEAILRVSGSLAFVAAARAAYIVTRDPGDATRRFPTKSEERPEGLFLRSGDGENAFHRAPDDVVVVPEPDPLKTGRRKCVSCDGNFLPARPWSRFCSPACRLRAHRRLAEHQKSASISESNPPL